MRKTVNLNYDWNYIPSFKEEYINNLNIDNQEKVMIPHTMKELPLNYFNDEDYQFIGTYSRILQINEEMLKNILELEFKAVMNVCKIYLNGELLTIHEGGYTPFTVDITKKATIGDNLLQVIVNSEEIDDVPPFGNFIDYLCFSGIYREVALNILPKTYLKKVHIATAETNALYEDEMLMDLEVSLNQETDIEYSVRVTLISVDNKKYSTTFKEKLKEKYLYTSTFKDIKRWDIDNPNLYNVLVELLNEEEVVDTYKTRIGFRTATFTPEGFLLNNKPVKLIGLNRHQSYPYVGYAMPKRIQELDADILKEYGCNIVRTSHYMQSDHFLNRCDELGLLVLEETPGWQYIGNDHFKELTYQNITDMINSHFNHPSIVTWGVRINESQDDHDFYAATNELARTIDPSRPTCGIRNTKKGEMLEDIYTYNDFSHTGNNLGLEPVNKVVPGYKPYLITEHNGHVFPTKKNDTEERRKSQALRHTEVLDSIYSSKRYSGAIGWCLSDYNTHIQFGSNDHICHHGVMDMFRIPKYAAYTYRAQREDESLLFVASNMISGDFDEFLLPETIVFTNCDYIKVYKNDEFIGEFEPNYDEFPNLPYPPVIFDDYIGDLIVNSKEFKEKDARGITSILNGFYHYGFNVPLKIKLKYLNLLRKGVVNNDVLVRLHEKHLAHQSKGPIIFKFEGYVDDELVLTTKRGHTKQANLVAEVDHLELEHGITYDATRVVVSLRDEFGYDLTFANDVLEIKTSNHLEVIGPCSLALVGGSTAFYVKTTGKPGKASIKITSNRNQEVSLDINIKKGTLS